jgi:hypothetical protein
MEILQNIMNGSTIKMLISYATAAQGSHQSTSFSAKLQKENPPNPPDTYLKLFPSS